jgi:bifunctional DNA-binding transcriptional regulator/antitoxin component of YhaV-PrlF toxin-antitoxin module
MKGGIMQNLAKITSKGQSTVPREIQRVLGFEAVTNCYSKAMARAYLSGRLGARARFQSIAALVPPKFRLAEKELRNGCAE